MITPKDGNKKAFDLKIIQTRNSKFILKTVIKQKEENVYCNNVLGNLNKNLSYIFPIFRKNHKMIRKNSLLFLEFIHFFGEKSPNSLGKSMFTLKCGKFLKIYMIYLFSKFLGNISWFFWNLSIFWGKSSNSLRKSMFTLKCEIFLNNEWEKFHKFFIMYKMKYCKLYSKIQINATICRYNSIIWLFSFFRKIIIIIIR